ncbi:MAG: hypothetical protein RIQ81_1093 [Pseudomonadota bacterium]|jgi:hypothetical protein
MFRYQRWTFVHVVGLALMATWGCAQQKEASLAGTREGSNRPGATGAPARPTSLTANEKTVMMQEFPPNMPQAEVQKKFSSLTPTQIAAFRTTVAQSSPSTCPTPAANNSAIGLVQNPVVQCSFWSPIGCGRPKKVGDSCGYNSAGTCQIQADTKTWTSMFCSGTWAYCVCGSP